MEPLSVNRAIPHVCLHPDYYPTYTIAPLVGRSPDSPANHEDTLVFIYSNLVARMLVNKAMLAVLAAAAMLCGSRTDAAPSAFKVCGRHLSEIMARVCHVYNSPSWDAPTVVEQPASALRKRRETSGISDCCEYGCTWEQLSEYCSEVSANSDLSLETYDTARDMKRSADSAAASKAEATPPWRAVVENVTRALPSIGTVSPLLTWGRTLNTDFPQVDRDRYAYIAVYST
ncbi:insulin-like growth factor II [Phthorimaea operculella]|nr:insulin-like growth factor II [Phthorimaea operculella]